MHSNSSSDSAAGDVVTHTDSVFAPFSTFVFDVLPVAHADDEKEGEDSESWERVSADGGGNGGEKGADLGGSEEEMGEEEGEEEPEDPAPAIREECENSKACASVKHHFEECEKRIEEGRGFKGEDCVEELCSRQERVWRRRAQKDVNVELGSASLVVLSAGAFGTSWHPCSTEVRDALRIIGKALSRGDYWRKDKSNLSIH